MGEGFEQDTTASTIHFRHLMWSRLFFNHSTRFLGDPSSKAVFSEHQFIQDNHYQRSIKKKKTLIKDENKISSALLGKIVRCWGVSLSITNLFQHSYILEPIDLLLYKKEILMSLSYFRSHFQTHMLRNLPQQILRPASQVLTKYQVWNHG